MTLLNLQAYQARPDRHRARGQKGTAQVGTERINSRVWSSVLSTSAYLTWTTARCPSGAVTYRFEDLHSYCVNGHLGYNRGWTSYIE